MKAAKKVTKQVKPILTVVKEESKLVRYVTDSKLHMDMERLNNKVYKIRQDFREMFDIEYSDRCCGNVRVIFSKKVGKARLVNMCNNNKYTPDYQQISSALAFYRAVSMFGVKSIGKYQDYYKCNWSVNLKHKETGKYLILGEWKGGFQIFTEDYKLNNLPKEFIKDVERFLTFFVSMSFPIGYDGVIAGGVA